MIYFPCSPLCSLMWSKYRTPLDNALYVHTRGTCRHRGVRHTCSSPRPTLKESAPGRGGGSLGRPHGALRHAVFKREVRDKEMAGEGETSAHAHSSQLRASALGWGETGFSAGFGFVEWVGVRWLLWGFIKSQGRKSSEKSKTQLLLRFQSASWCFQGGEILPHSTPSPSP